MRTKFFGEYELILVDDGSPDLSIYKAEAVIKRYPKMNYRVVHKENGDYHLQETMG